MSMTTDGNPGRRVLEPSERVAEVLFGLIMVLTFTGSLSVASASSNDVRTMLIGALGCNFAWGIIDAILYLMGSLAARGSNIRIWRALKKAPDPEVGRQVIIDALPPLVGATLGSAELEAMRQKLELLPEPPLRPSLHKDDWIGAAGVFLWVFVTTFPVAVPFIFVHDVEVAMRVSNGIAIVLLFLTGYAFGLCSEFRPWLTGFAMVVIGSILVAFTIALGG